MSPQFGPARSAGEIPLGQTLARSGSRRPRGLQRAKGEAEAALRLERGASESRQQDRKVLRYVCGILMSAYLSTDWSVCIATRAAILPLAGYSGLTSARRHRTWTLQGHAQLHAYAQVALHAADHRLALRLGRLARRWAGAVRSRRRVPARASLQTLRQSLCGHWRSDAHADQHSDRHANQHWCANRRRLYGSSELRVGQLCRPRLLRRCVLPAR